MPAAIYETDVINEFYRRNYRPAVIHYVPMPPPEIHDHVPVVYPPIHHHPPPEAPGRGKALIVVGLGLMLLGLTAFEEEE